jgi:PHD/YefM family antitoxin component YafN of YafNO toxin-antitoxin module
MDMTLDADSLTNFAQDAAGFLKQLKQTGRPLALTVDGRPELVVQDARSYRRLLDLVDRLETIRAVKTALAEADRGEGQDADQFFDELKRELRIGIEE